MPDTVQDLARRLARDAEAVCRHYLPKGRRQGHYWLVGDVDNTPGGSLFVRLSGTDFGPGAAGKWTDAATGQHGDLLDLIAANRHLTTWRDTLDEVRRFLSLPQPDFFGTEARQPAPVGSPLAARRLWAMSRPTQGTLAEAYLHGRGLTDLRNCTNLRFHPRCYYRQDAAADDDARQTWPALIAAVTDLDGGITGVHRTWLTPTGEAKAPVTTPRRAMGSLHGHGVRFRPVDDVVAAGEGIETMLSLRCALPTLPMVAALSANHLAALIMPTGLRRLYIARDNDTAGRRATEALTERAVRVGIETVVLEPTLGDWNDDLRQLGSSTLANGVRGQLAPEDVARFWRPGTRVAARRGDHRQSASGDRQVGTPV
jgi:hypothetical protein